tara:strand:- start:838 stop:1401 length:564 start_codon:yes stop_codon:yes gene_type:complete
MSVNQQKSLLNELERLKRMQSSPPLLAPPPPQQPAQPSVPSLQQLYTSNRIKQLETQVKQQQPKPSGFTYTENKRNAILSWALLLMIPVFLMSIDKYEADLFNIAFVSIYISFMGYVNPAMFRVNPLILIISGMASWFIFKYFVVGVAKHKAHRKKLTNTNRILFVIMMMIIMTAMMRVLPHKAVFV